MKAKLGDKKEKGSHLVCMKETEAIKSSLDRFSKITFYMRSLIRFQKVYIVQNPIRPSKCFTWVSEQAISNHLSEFSWDHHRKACIAKS